MSTQAVTESLWTSMPQQRENSICINAPFAAGLDAEKESDNPSRALPGPGLQPATDCMPGHAGGDTALCQQKRPARFTNVLDTPDQCRLAMPPEPGPLGASVTRSLSSQPARQRRAQPFSWTCRSKKSFSCIPNHILNVLTNNALPTPRHPLQRPLGFQRLAFRGDGHADSI